MHAPVIHVDFRAASCNTVSELLELLSKSCVQSGHNSLCNSLIKKVHQVYDKDGC